MKCEDFIKLLDEDKLLEKREAISHMETCSDCRDAFELWRKIADEMKAMGREEAPFFLHTRIMAHVREVRSEGTASRWFSWRGIRLAWAGPFSVLALFLILGGYGVLRVLQPHREPVPLDQLSQPHQMASAPSEDEKGVGGRRLPHVDLPTVGRAEKKNEDTFSQDSPVVGEESDSEKSLTDSGTSGIPAAPERLAEEALESDRYDREPPASAETRQVSPRGTPPESPGMILRSSPLPELEDKRLMERELAAPAESQASDEGLRRRDQGKSKKEVVIMTVLVDCTLVPDGDGEMVLVRLPEENAPSPGENWTVLVKETGDLQVVDDEGSTLDAVTEAIRRKLQQVNLLPGRYRLGRFGH